MKKTIHKEVKKLQNLPTVKRLKKLGFIVKIESKNKTSNSIIAKVRGPKKEWTKKTIIEEAKKYNTNSKWIRHGRGSYEAARKMGRDFLNRCRKHMDKKFYQVRDVSEEDILSTIKKYSSVSEWKSGHSISYRAARKRGAWFMKFCSYDIESRNTTPNSVSNAELIRNAKKYKTKEEWMSSSPDLYAIAQKRVIVRQCCAHMNKKWDEASVMKEAKKYRTRSEWCAKNRNSYNFARTRSIAFFESCCAHMPVLKRKWTKKAMIEEAKKYKTKYEWQYMSNGSYSKAFHAGSDFFESCTKHMTKRTYWTNDQIIEEAKKYKTRSEWSQGSPTSYQLSFRRGINNICTQHMVRARSPRMQCQADLEKLGEK